MLGTSAIKAMNIGGNSFAIVRVEVVHFKAAVVTARHTRVLPVTPDGLSVLFSRLPIRTWKNAEMLNKTVMFLRFFAQGD